MSDLAIVPSPSSPPTPLESIREELRHVSPDDKASALHLQVIERLFETYDFVLVGLGDSIFEGGVRVYVRPHNSFTYRSIDRLPLRRLILQAAQSLSTPRSLTGTQVNRIMETFGDRPPILTTIERRVFQVSEDLYFNLDAACDQDQLVHGDELPSNARCFFRLFDTSEEDKDTVMFPASTFDSSFSDQVLFSYNSLLSLLEELAPNPTDKFPEASLSATSQEDGDPLPRHFSFIEDWADHNPGLYWDLLTIPATVFLKEKPQVSYFLSGTGANGKSAYLGLIHTILGTNNTTRNRISEMSKWHLNTLLQYTLFNAPDDEGDSVFDGEETLRIFKSFSAHATVFLPIMRSQKPMRLQADFMSAHPMNASPDWGDVSSASALTRRTCLIPFTADFRDFKRTSNFAKDTFTPDVLAKLTGEILALATFYSTHPIEWSKTVTATFEQVEAENDSIRVYQRAWEKYFGAFQNISLLYDDYRCWCVNHDLPYTKDLSAFKVHWRAYMANRSKAWITGVDYEKLSNAEKTIERENCLSRPGFASANRARALEGKPPLLAMLALTKLPYKELENHGTISDMHHIEDLEKGVGHTCLSAVYLMERMDENGG